MAGRRWLARSADVAASCELPSGEEGSGFSSGSGQHCTIRRLANREGTVEAGEAATAYVRNTAKADFACQGDHSRAEPSALPRNRKLTGLPALYESIDMA